MSTHSHKHIHIYDYINIFWAHLKPFSSTLVCYNVYGIPIHSMVCRCFWDGKYLENVLIWQKVFTLNRNLLTELCAQTLFYNTHTHTHTEKHPDACVTKTIESQRRIGMNHIRDKFIGRKCLCTQIRIETIRMSMKNIVQAFCECACSPYILIQWDLSNQIKCIGKKASSAAFKGMPPSKRFHYFFSLLLCYSRFDFSSNLFKDADKNSFKRSHWHEHTQLHNIPSIQWNQAGNVYVMIDSCNDTNIRTHTCSLMLLSIS